MNLIDTHAHIYLKEFDPDRLEMLERGFNAGIETILMPAIDSSTHASMMSLEKDDSRCLSMMGLHPCSVNQDFQKELKIAEEHLKTRPFKAIGEIGLDFYWDKTYTNEQYKAFHQQIEWAMERGLPIAIHSRNATDECIEVVKKYPGLRGVFHCFSGTYDQASMLISINFYLGIGGVVTFKNGGLDKVVEKIGLDNIILETDAPYLAPVPFRGKRNEPFYLKHIISRIAELCGIREDEIAEKTTNNAKQLFNL